MKMLNQIQEEILNEISFDKMTEYTKKAYASREKAGQRARAFDNATAKEGTKTYNKREKGLKLLHKRSKGFYGEK
jgi:hypothetical protein